MYTSVEVGNINSIMFVTAGVMLMLRVHQYFSKKVEYVFLLNSNKTCLQESTITATIFISERMIGNI